MALKFPLPHPLFPPFQLSDADSKHYAQLAMVLVDQALGEYEHYERAQCRQVDKRRWKIIKSRENVIAYSERHRHVSNHSTPAPKPLAAQLRSRTVRESTSDDCASPVTPTTEAAAPKNSDWNSPNLLAVGTIAGSLDETMYGVATFDPVSMLLKTTHTKDGVMDGEVLSPIEGPTPDEPYRFLGIKWMAVAGGGVANVVLWPRDFVFLEATGIRELPNGNRIGYHVMHSLELPGYGPIQRRHVVRGRLSSCYLFKQLPQQTVDVYMKTRIDSNCKRLPETIAQFVCATGLLYCWKAVVCAQNKKLVRLVMKTHRQRHNLPIPPPEKASSCGICKNSIGKIHRRVDICQICCVSMCSKCRVAKKLSFVGADAKQVNQAVVVFCTSCVTQSNQTSALEVAKEEVLTGRWAHLSKYSEKSASDATQRRTRNLSVVLAGGDGNQWYANSFLVDPSTQPKTRVLNSKGLKEVTNNMEPTINSNRQQHQQHHRTLTHQEQLWLRIVELCETAESVYQIAKQTTTTHISRGTAASIDGHP